MAQINVGDPVTFEATIQDDGVVVTITGGTFTLKDPVSVKTDFSGILTTDGSDGKVKFTTTYNADPLLASLSIGGNWQLQVLATTSSGGPWESSIYSFRVEENL